jgi:limonene-1,2-epoxide hydrolase
MGRKQEAVVMLLLDRIAADDREGATALYAENGSYHVNAWHDPMVGHAAIRGELDRQAGLFSNFRYRVVSIASTDSAVYTERIDTITMAGKDVSVHWASVHELGPDGLITSSRDYYDMKEIEAQLT